MTVVNVFEGSEEYLYVARTQHVDVETRSLDVDEQLNRVFVARKIQLASEALAVGDRENSVQHLQQAFDKIQSSASKGMRYCILMISLLFACSCDMTYLNKTLF